MKKSKQIADKRKYIKRGWVVISGGFVLVFLLGVISTLGYQAVIVKAVPTTQYAFIQGSDGLMGLVGYVEPFANSKTVQYSVTYFNSSSQDRAIKIKATQFSRNPNDNKRDSNGSLAGVITTSSYSDSAIVKAGTAREFDIVTKQTKYPESHYIELEAFKTTEQ